MFAAGAYFPLQAIGVQAEHMCAFARCLGDEAVIALAPVLVARLSGGRAVTPLGSDVWKDTCLALPEALQGRRLTNVHGHVIKEILA